MDTVEITVQFDAKQKKSNTAYARYMSNAVFLIPTPQCLQKIITGLDDIYEHDIAELDMQIKIDRRSIFAIIQVRGGNADEKESCVGDRGQLR